MRRKIIGVIGASAGTAEDLENAHEVGRLIADKGWTLICGGLSGVMEAASRGASEAGGTVVGVLPQGDASHANRFVTIPIATNMGHARNMVIVHSADAVIAVGGGLGTLSEIAVALKLGKRVFGIGGWEIEGMTKAKNPKEAIDGCKETVG